MLEIEFEILSYISKQQPCHWTDVLNAFDPQSSCRITDSLLRCMLDEDLISVSDGNPPLCTVRISSQTVRMLAGYEEKRRKDAQRKREQEAEREFERREKRKDRMLTAAISVISALFGAIASAAATAILALLAA